MPSSTVGAGSGVEADPAEAVRFLRAWHGERPGALLEIAMIRRGAGEGEVADKVRQVSGGLVPVHAPLEELLEVLESDREGFARMGEDSNMYHSAGWLTEIPEAGRRGGRKLIGGTPGVWLDIDVKPDAFATAQEAHEFCVGMPVAPSIVVATGLGGCQGYWRVEGGLQPDAAERLGRAWHALALNRAGERVVDSVANADRLLRLPGSVRWPKALTESASVAHVLLDDGPVSRDGGRMLWDLANPAWTAREAQRTRAASRIVRGEMAAAFALEDAATGVGKWTGLLARASVQERFAESVSWAGILAGRGWTELGKDADGRTVWARPGGEGRRAACTDWPESPHVMSLFSEDVSTGLLEVKRAGVPLTKWRVWVELEHGGDEVAAVADWTGGEWQAPGW